MITQLDIVHRDIKPSNILVSVTGAVKLLDFGVAKVIEPEAHEAEASVTHAGIRVLTPEYASPDQFLGQPVSTASDIYSLGVLLYELLAGVRPHASAGATPGQLERATLETEVAPPSTAVHRATTRDTQAAAARARATTVDALRRKLRGDLDAIVLTAMRRAHRRARSADRCPRRRARRHARRRTRSKRCGAYAGHSGRKSAGFRQRRAGRRSIHRPTPPGRSCRMRIHSWPFGALALPAALLCSGPLRAQTGGSPVPRAIALPDTLGANFAIADSARATSGPDDLDFLVGMWHFRFQQRNADGTFGQPFTGHWLFERKRGGGAMVVDHWRRDDPGAAMDAGTWTYRTFNPQRGIWEMEGVDTGGGAWQPGLMWSDATSRYVIQHYGPVIVRFRYFAIEPDRFLWRADRSTDQGRTWLLDRWTMEVTRVGR